jgi:accessory gene regulator B
MISSVSNCIAKYIGTILNSSPDEIEVYVYGSQIIVGAIVKVVAILSLAWVLNTLNTTLILFITFASFRCFGGGAHLNSYARCLIFGITVIVGLGTLTQIDFSRITITLLFILIFIAAVYTGLKWVPGDTEKKQITDNKIRLRQKQKYFLVLIVWFLAVIFLMLLNLDNYALAIVLGCMGSILLITPAGYQLLLGIDKLATEKGGEIYDA